MLFGGTCLQAQVLNKPTAADNPNLAGNSAWTAACASSGFNEYYVNFTWSPPMVDSKNEFILELSDADGYFSSPRELAKVTDGNTQFDFDFKFNLPQDIRGENYRFRVRSTHPAKTSPQSDAYPMYYVDFNTPILISENGSGTIPAGGEIQLCGEGAVTLRPHNLPNAESYKFNWYHSGTLLEEKSQSITVFEPGMYFVELDYGSVCSGSANTMSNTITIATGESLGIAIQGERTLEVCPGTPQVLEANIALADHNYTWYKDGTVVLGPKRGASSYTVDTDTAGFEGQYAVEISGSGVCKEKSAPVALEATGSFGVSLDNGEHMVLLPGQKKTLSVATTAQSPTFQWYRDGRALEGATQAKLEIAAIGEYYVEVSEHGGPCEAAPLASPTISVVAPQAFEFKIDFVGSYGPCENTNATLNLVAIMAVGQGGAKTDVTTDLLSSFNYQWVGKGQPLSGENSKTLSLDSHEKNGTYVLQGQVDGFEAVSNALAVKLTVDGSLQIAANHNLLCEGGEPIVLSSSMYLEGMGFEWKRDGKPIDSSSKSLRVTQPGTYQLYITSFDCHLASNEVKIETFDEKLLVLDHAADLVIVEGETKTVTATGAQTYEWFDAGNNLISSTDSFAFQQEGEYLLIADFGSCTLSRVITVTYRDMFAIPNVITANGDGINDLWVLPNSYSRDPNVLVTIFNERGEQIFSQSGYENNWPQSTTAFNKPSMIFYYKISRGGNSLKQGTITVIK